MLEALEALFPKKVISLQGDIAWPPRSPDLSHLDYYLWGYLKGKVYNNNPKTIKELKANIRQEIAAIPKSTLARVIDNFGKRLFECQQRERGHSENIIFKK